MYMYVRMYYWYNTCTYEHVYTTYMYVCVGLPSTIKNFKGSPTSKNVYVTVCGKTNLIPHLFKTEIFIVLESTFPAD